MGCTVLGLGLQAYGVLHIVGLSLLPVIVSIYKVCMMGLLSMAVSLPGGLVFEESHSFGSMLGSRVFAELNPQP